MASLAVKAGVVSASRLLTRGSQLVAFVILARVLSPSDFGAYGVVTSAIFLAALIGNMGLRQAIAKAIGSNTLAPGEAATTALMCWPFLGVLCCIGLYISNSDQLNALGSISLGSVFTATLAVMLITLLQGVLLGKGNANEFALLDTAPRLIQTLAVIVLWLTDYLSITTVFISFALSFLLFVPQAFRFSYADSARCRARVDAIIPLVRSGFLFALSLFIIMFQSRVGLFILDDAASTHAVGQFFAAQRASEIILDASTATAIVLFSEAARSSDPHVAAREAVKVSVSLFIAFTIIGIGVAAAAPFIVRIALGSSYAGAEEALTILSLGLGPTAAARVVSSMLAGLGRPNVSAAVASLGLAVNVALCLAITPRWGASGAAVALVGGQSVSCVAYIVVLRHLFGLRLNDLLPSLSNLLQKLRRLSAWVRR